MKRFLLIAGTIFCAHHAVFAQLPNGGMEQWRNFTVSSNNFELPLGWHSADSLVTTLPSAFIPNPQKHVFQTSSAHSGSSAAMVMSRNVGGAVGALPGVLSNARVGFDLTKYLTTGDPAQAIALSGGSPVSGRVGGVKAMVKYTTKATDTAGMAIRAILNNASTGNKDSLIGEGYAMITASNNYQQIFAPVSYINGSVVPTHIIVAFASSAGVTAIDSSAVYVDDVDFISVGVNDVAQQSTLTVYPNPAAGFLSVRSEVQGWYNLEAYNLQGQLVTGARFFSKTVLDLSAFSNGMYTYRISDDKGGAVQRGTFVVSK